MKLFTKNVPIHFYHTSGKVQVQGSPMIQGMSSVVWLVEYLRKKDINTEILPDTGSKCRYNLKESVRLLLKKLESPALKLTVQIEVTCVVNAYKKAHS